MEIEKESEVDGTAVTEAVFTLCDGNPGAIAVCISIMANMPVWFPDTHTKLPPTHVLEIFNAHAFYGRNIFLLAHKMCAGDLGMVVAYALAMQENIVDPEKLKQECENVHANLPSHYQTNDAQSDVLGKLASRNVPFKYVSTAPTKAS